MPKDESLEQAAIRMRDEGIGDVIVNEGDYVCGVITDRDIVVRAVAEGRDMANTAIGESCSSEMLTLGPDDSVDTAIERMRERAVRRVPVLEDGKPVGVVSLGDLAVARDPQSALADISAARDNG